MFTAYRPWARTIGVMNRLRSRATMTSGGSSDTDDSAFTVIPTGWPSSSVVTTLIPVANRPITSRNVSGAACIAFEFRRARTIRPMTTERWDRAALVPVRRGERRAEVVALPAGLPTVEELFTFMRDAERRFETLKMRIEERTWGARGEE